MTMGVLLASLVLATSVTFGAPEVDGTVVDSGTVEYVVSVEAPEATSVVLHALDPGSEQLTVAMRETSPGRYRTRFEIRPLDYVIVFEDLGSGTQSRAYRLSDLGLDSELIGGEALIVPDPGSQTSLGWLALGLGLASLSALAFWSLGGSRKERERPPELPAESVE